MQQRSDDRLVAYLDGELEMAERRDIEAWLDGDPAARDRLAALAASANLLRRAFDEAMHEPVPERLIAAARGIEPNPAARIVRLPPRRDAGRAPTIWRRWAGLPIAAAIFGLLVGGGAGFYGLGAIFGGHQNRQPGLEAAANNTWLDNAAGYFKLYAAAGDNALVEVPATGDTTAALQKISQTLAQQVRLPNLKPWGLDFRGARLVVVEGRPAAQIVYSTDNKAIGPLTLLIGSSQQPDVPPSVDHRENVNLLYWRHQGRSYALVGQANIGYLWGIANDVAWQLDAI
jgi:anti-sigma factor RsiW